jgi:hypothetical protein
MAQPLVILLLVLASDAAHASMGPLAEATREALGEAARVVIEPREAMPTDAEASLLERTVGAGALVEVIWIDPTHRHVRLRVHVRDAWIDRELAFAPNDDVGERGRTIGLAVASTLPPMATIDVPNETAGGPSTPASDSAPPVQPVRGNEASPASDDSRGAKPFVAGRNSPSGAVAAATGLTLAVSPATTTAVGAFAAIGWMPSSRLWVHVRVDGRVGDVPAIDARLMSLATSAHAAWQPLEISKWMLGGDVGAGALYDDLGRTTAELGTIHRSRWIPMVTAFAIAEWRARSDMGLLAAFGPEVALGQTRIFIGERDPTVLPSVRWLGQVALRVGF